MRFPRLYDLLIGITTWGRAREYRQDLVDLAGIEPGHRVLDVGCGTGSFAIAAWSRTQPGGSVSGVDVSSEALRVAGQKNLRARSAVEFIDTQANELPFQDGTFDVVTMIAVLHAVPQATRRVYMSEMGRVLRSTGHIVLVDFAGDVHRRRYWIARHGAHGEFDLYQFGSQPRQHGFDIVKTGDCGWLDLGYIKLSR